MSIAAEKNHDTCTNIAPPPNMERKELHTEKKGEGVALVTEAPQYL